MSRAVIFTFSFFFLAGLLNAQHWQAVPLVSKAILSHGQQGGEGCQVVQAIEADHTDGSFLLMGTDVGGIYRSNDGGQHWVPCNIGYSARGNIGFAIDPNNPNRALAVGANSTSNNSHGIYLTTDRGASWTQVLAMGTYSGYRSFKDKIEFVKNSFDSAAGYSSLAFWSSPAGGIFRSLNGGTNWTKVNNAFGDCNLKVHPDSGYVYVIKSDGFYKSTDSAKTFSLKLAGVFTDMDVIDSRPGSIYLTTANKLYRSEDSGESFTNINGSSYPGNVITLNVSPAKPDYLVVCNKENDWGGPVFYSQNGGLNWVKATHTHQDAFMPFNTRTHKFAWHPTDSSRVWALGGDWISSSSDGGKNFHWDANGYNGILVGGLFNFNLFRPGLLLVGSQDYNGAFTSDFGLSWTYCNISNQGWGGFTYGAYAANEDVLVSQNCPGWGQNGYLSISRNGGKSFSQTGLLCTGMDVGMGDPKDSMVIYFSNYRSHDLGLSWIAMSGCQGVFCANPFGEQEVYGANGRTAVRSNDRGVSWTTIRTLASNIIDMSIDHRTGRLFVVTEGDRLFRLTGATIAELTSRIPVDQYNARSVRSVSVDPQDPDLVYIAGAKDIYKTDATIKRSTDGGETFQIYNPNNRTNNGAETGDGVNESFAIRVNPATRELWAAGGCYGIWKDRNEDKNSIVLTSPAPFASLMASDSIAIVASLVQFGDSIEFAEFYMGDSVLAADSIAPYAYTWKNIPAGTHILHARAHEWNGRIFYTPAVNVHAYASHPPEVMISSPSADSLFPENSNLDLEVLANDPDGTVVKVEYFVNGKKIGESTDAPFSFPWKNVSRGTYIIHCIATDNSGETTQSSAVSIQFFGPAGKVSYIEDFNDGLAQKWKNLTGSWQVTDFQYSHTSGDGVYRCIYEGSSFYDYTFSVKTKAAWGNILGLIFNYQDSKNYYLLTMDTDPLTAVIKRVKNGAESTLKTASYSGGGTNVTVPVTIQNKSGLTTITISNKVVFNMEPTPDFLDGMVGFYTWYNPAWFDDVEVIASAKLYTGIDPVISEEESTIRISSEQGDAGTCRVAFKDVQNEVFYRITDLEGREINSEKLFNVKEFMVPGLQQASASGLYLLQVKSGKTTATFKIVMH
jgi:photosystem II stability/assembly factor-like uncharacterized protein